MRACLSRSVTSAGYARAAAEGATSPCSLNDGLVAAEKAMKGENNEEVKS